MLPELPVSFDEREHSYCWIPTGESMVWSVSDVATPRSEEDKAFFKKNPQYAERGTRAHSALESFLLKQAHIHLEEDEAWIRPLLDHPWWKRVDEVVACEYRLCWPERSLGGSFDFLVRMDNGDLVLGDLKTKQSPGAARRLPLAQLGGYCQMLAQHHPKQMPDRCAVVWCCPELTEVDEDSLATEKCVDRWDAAWVRHENRQELF